MRLVAQRVLHANVRVGGEPIAGIGPGLLLLVGIAPDDGDDDARWLARKIVAMRIFDDADGEMNRSVADAGGAILAVSQFTLYASTQKGNRPSWSGAAAAGVAEPAFARFVALLEQALGTSVATGRFGANMAVELVNDGPVTLLLDSRQRD